MHERSASCLSVTVGGRRSASRSTRTPLPQVDIPAGPLAGAAPARPHLGHRARRPAGRAGRSCCCTRSAAPGCSPGSRPCTSSPKRYRVVVFDQRWHGRGIISENFSRARLRRRRGRGDHRARPRPPDRRRLLDGLDRRPAGVAPAPRPRRRADPRRDHRPLPHQRPRDASSTPAWSSRWARCARSPSRAPCAGPPGRPPRRSTSAPTDTGTWALNEWRSTSPWAMAQAVAALGRHHSTPWLSPHRRAHRRRHPVARPRHPGRAPAPPRRADPGRHPARGRLRPRRLRAAGRPVRAGLPRGRQRHRRPDARPAPTRRLR